MLSSVDNFDTLFSSTLGDFNVRFSSWWTDDKPTEGSRTETIVTFN